MNLPFQPLVYRDDWKTHYAGQSVPFVYVPEYNQIGVPFLGTFHADTLSIEGVDDDGDFSSGVVIGRDEIRYLDHITLDPDRLEYTTEWYRDHLNS